MKLLDFLTLMVAVCAAMTIAVSKLYGLHFPSWRFAQYETIFLLFLVFSCVFQFVRGFSRLASDD
ncbi:hypothetical protein FP2506_01390 [Fulvimarina pelagi HTCC2506]|uniref:Uncharacterized protein n=1 Tax=Fulvimarina pelagi HTCC2506 TaxID=314231 RepID=Q0G219_9HYPH|nr:hypothetical protein [Fulvimarina pelagi]EAU41379.1 hypothetical protein FP2506_01390 [Fulvimarina pelagi HTCC2506]